MQSAELVVITTATRRLDDGRGAVTVGLRVPEVCRVVRAVFPEVVGVASRRRCGTDGVEVVTGRSRCCDEGRRGWERSRHSTHTDAHRHTLSQHTAGNSSRCYIHSIS